MTDAEAADAIRVLGIAGSLRRGSYNRALLRAAAELAPVGMHIEPYDLHGIPLYDFDVEQKGDPEPVLLFKEAIAGVDAVLIATPEYQHSIPGVLKNALDWASRPPRKAALTRKPAAIMGAAPGMLGTARAQSVLRQVLVYNRSPVVLQPEVLVARAGEKFDENGQLTDEMARKLLRELLEELAELVRRFR